MSGIGTDVWLNCLSAISAAHLVCLLSLQQWHFVHLAEVKNYKLDISFITVTL